MALLVRNLLVAAAAAALVPSSTALTLQSTTASVVLDDTFPRPLNYTLSATGETMQAALTGWGYHTSLSFNKGQVTCGEAGMATSYAMLPGPPGTETSAFTTTAACMVNWLETASNGRPAANTGGVPPLLTLTLNGTITMGNDEAVAGAGLLSWALEGMTVEDGPASSLSLTTLDLAGMEVLSFHPVPITPGTPCMYTPTQEGTAPACGGDSYVVDSWTNDGIDEWWSGTWDTSTVTGEVEVNTVAGTNQGCIDGVLSRHGPGPMASVTAGGWSKSGKTGVSVISSEKHTPFWTGLRSHRLRGRCNTFTVAPSTIHTSYLCGGGSGTNGGFNGLPYTLTVGIFPDVTQDGVVDSEDVYLWRRMQYPRSDVLYRTTLPYKIQVDMTSYDSTLTRMPFTGVLGYVANISLITDGYPQTPILVGWQGLGHDTVYPGWDVINIHADVGGDAQLVALAQGVKAASGSNATSLSYHVNADEGYSKFNSSSNADFDQRICRVNVDGVTPWALNCSATNYQVLDCGIRCSISKAKDNALYGRYERYSRFFTTVPSSPPMRTIHSDAWRDVGASWELDPSQGGLGFIDWANEQRCGQQADSAFWASHGMSMGVEGNDGQAAELMGTVSFLYHSEEGWSPVNWGRWVAGTELGWDLDVSCNNPGWRCSWEDMANNWWGVGAVYQLALTDELLSSKGGVYRFAGGGMLQAGHVAHGGIPPVVDRTWQQGARLPTADEARRARRAGKRAGAKAQRDALPTLASSLASSIPIPSTWPYGGDSIPILDGKGGVLVPRVLPDGATLDAAVLHAYQQVTTPMPDASCPLYSNSSALYTGSDSTAISNWNGVGPDAPYYQYEGDPSKPQAQFITDCNATCWANASCGAWDVIKVTGNSGHTKPLCMLFTHATGCQSDPNQFAGVKTPLPVPPPPPGVIQSWTLPLSWVGHDVLAVSITPTGQRTDVPTVTINGRDLTLTGVQPGWPVRLTRA